ncbi:MAG: DUF4293 domain-containing protein [Paludibacteraceae bacterium]|nr:DUF4293 domain-containing protein [Paludibacteraceae bacterium]
MIQRRQTLYLLTIVILGIVLCFCSVLQFTTPEYSSVQRMFYLSSLGIEEVSPEMSYMDLPVLHFPSPMWLFITNILISLFALIDIFLYKKRIIQARLNIFLAVLCLGYYGMLAVYVWFAHRMLVSLDQVVITWDICFGACIPLVCFVLTLGATRLILQDEMKVQAADRLR